MTNKFLFGTQCVIISQLSRFMETNTDKNPVENTDLQESASPDPSPKKRNLAVVIELLQFIVIAVILVLGIRVYIAQPFIVSGDSMIPNFENGQYLIVDELSYHLRTPERGEVVIFKYPRDNSKFFIKRIVGLPGETIVVENQTVSIEKGDEATLLEEPYIKGKTFKDTRLELKENEYFVLGDNREASSDSRSWGAVREDLIVGRAFVRLFPVTAVSFLPGVHEFEFMHPEIILEN